MAHMPVGTISTLLYYIVNTLFHTRPGRSDLNYNLKPRCHNLVLTAKRIAITTDGDFIILE